MVEHRKVIGSIILTGHYDFSDFCPIHHRNIGLSGVPLRSTTNNLTDIGIVYSLPCLEKEAVANGDMR